jgi:UPF0755 protein
MSQNRPLPPDGRRPGTIEGWQVRQPVHRRRTAPWRGLAFLGVAVIVLVGGAWMAFGPSLRAAAVNMFQDNAQAIRMPFVSDLLASELTSRVNTPAGGSGEPVTFVIEEGQSLPAIEEALVEAGLLEDRLAFQYLVISREVDGLVVAGNYTMPSDVTPSQLVDRLAGSPDPITPRVTLALRDGLRIEQIVALLQTLGLETDVRAFHDLVTDPPAELIDEYDFLSLVPKGNSLEGFLGAGVFEIPVDITPTDLARLLLDDWQADIGSRFMAQAQERARDFYEVMTIASLVEREAVVDAERARIAGVYTNRLDPSLNPTLLMNADPTVIYAVDTLALRDLPFERWPQYSFWQPVGRELAGVSVPGDLRSYQTYTQPGLPKAPIASPSRASVAAALSPNTRRGLLYFYACPGERTHQFARTLAQHQRNIQSCS